MSYDQVKECAVFLLVINLGLPIAIRLFAFVTWKTLSLFRRDFTKKSKKLKFSFFFFEYEIC